MTNDRDHDMIIGAAEAYLSRLSKVVAALDTAAFDAAIGLVKSAWDNGKQIIVFGNGGSALTAQHFVTDWNKMIYLRTRKPFRGVCLAVNMGLVTAYGNDVSYDDVFLEQLKPVLNKDDLVIAISGSGNSKNVLRPVQYANDNGGITLGLCGFDGGKLKRLARHSICANVHDIQLSEDIHLMFGHMTVQTLCGLG
jgi:D-sedoheptulose 7-phosphate isomerase